MSKYEIINEYNKNNYFVVTLRIPKEKEITLKELADAEDVSVNKLIIRAIEKTYGISLRKDSK
jgi:predicted HicB family RNase H-like nuclease